MTRNEKIKLLMENDFNDIMGGGIPDYLNSILESGHKGYANYSDDELDDEISQREELNDNAN